MSGLRFSDDAYVVQVTETQASDADVELTPPDPVTGNVLSVTCTHRNGTPVADPSDLRYSISSDVDGRFSINATSGEFSVADVPFDYEQNQLHVVGLLCYLDSNRDSNGTGEVRVSVGPVNEYLPIISASSSSSVQVIESSPVGTVIAALDPGEALFTYTATDEDFDDIITYTLTAEEEEDSLRVEQFFHLDQFTGKMMLTQELDVDDLPGDNPFERLDMSITACNEGISSDSCNAISLTLFVTPANDNDPAFLQSQYAASVNESAPNGTLVAQVECEDKDKGDGRVEGISFEHGTSPAVLAAFELDSTGTILLQDQLDYENTTSYQFALVCSDGYTTATTQVAVTVLPVNDNAPTFLQDHYDFSADRSDPSPSDTIVGVVEASDADEGTGSTSTYSIASSSKFEIDEESGEITAKGYIYIIDGGTFEFDVIASDGEFQSTATVRVMMTGLLSLPEWIFVGLAGLVLLVILAVVGLIILYCFIKAARVRIKYKER